MPLVTGSWWGDFALGLVISGTAMFVFSKDDFNVTLWNHWRKPRIERLADGTTAVYFGIGRLTWR